jgi:hypothetical protein
VFDTEPRAVASGIRTQLFSFMFMIRRMQLLVQRDDAACALIPLATARGSETSFALRTKPEMTLSAMKFQ